MSCFFLPEWQLNVLAHADCMMADGALSTSHEPFPQVYTIIGNFHESRKNIPVCTCLVLDKQADTFIYVWELLSHNLTNQP